MNAIDILDAHFRKQTSNIDQWAFSQQPINTKKKKIFI